ncbi:MAG: hypothetical protein V3S25_11545 [Nitrospirales bacterium]
MKDDWELSNLLHKHKRRAPLVDEHERPSAGPAQPSRKKDRPWKVEYRVTDKQLERERKWAFWFTRWNCRRWRTWGAYKTENARDNALASMQRRNQDYWIYRKKDMR